MAVNSGTLLVLMGLKLRMEVYNTSIILLIIEWYTYFLITYGFVFMVHKTQTIASDQAQIGYKSEEAADCRGSSP